MAPGGPKAVSQGRYSPDLMTARIWCLASNWLIFSIFEAVYVSTSMRVALYEKERTSKLSRWGLASHSAGAAVHRRLMGHDGRKADCQKGCRVPNPPSCWKIEAVNPTSTAKP